MLKKFLFGLLSFVLVAGGGYVYTKRYLPRDIGNDLIKRVNKVTKKNYKEFYKNVEKYSYLLPSDFVQEVETTHENFSTIFEAYDVSYLNGKIDETREKLTSVYESLVDSNFKYIDKDYYIRQIPVLPYLVDYFGLRLLNEDGYSMCLSRTSISKSSKILLSFEVNVPLQSGKDAELVRREIEVRENYEYNNAIHKIFEEEFKNSYKGVSLYFSAPYELTVETKAGSYLFKLQDCVKLSLIDMFRNLDKSNFTDAYRIASQNASRLPQDFLDEINGAETHIKAGFNSQGSYDKTKLQKLEDACRYFTENEFTYLDAEKIMYNFSVTQFLLKCKNATFTNEQGYSLTTYEHIDSSISVSLYGYAEAYLTINVPLVKNGSAEEIKVRTTSNASGGSYLLPDILDDTGKYLAEKGVSLHCGGLYVVIVTTPAGDFKFDIKQGIFENVKGYLNNISKNNLQNIKNEIDSSLNFLPQDLIDEFNDALPVINRAFNYFMSTYDVEKDKDLTECYNYFSTKEFKYINAEALISNFPVTMYLDYFKNFTFVNKDGYTLFVNKYMAGMAGCEYGTLQLFLPLKEGGEPENFKSEHNTANVSEKPKILLNVLCDNFGDLKANNISLHFVKPFVVSVWTDGGKFEFDLKNILVSSIMDSFKNITKDNYSSTFSNIDKYKEFLSTEFVSEASSLKEALTSFLTDGVTYNIASTKVKNCYSAYFKTIFEDNHEYLDVDHLRDMLLCYPYFDSYENKKIMNSDGYSIEYFYDRESEVNGKGFCYLNLYVPMEEGKDAVYQSIKLRPVNEQDKFDDTEGAYLLVDVAREITELGISIVLTSPSNIDVKTPAGTYSFYFVGGMKLGVIDRLNNITYATRTEDFEYINYAVDNGYLDYDLCAEYSKVHSFLEPVFNIKYQEYNYDPDYVIEKYDTSYEGLFKTSYEHFKPLKVIDDFLLYPYICKKEGQTLTSSEGYTIKFVYEETDATNSVGKGSVILNMPITKSGETTELKVDCDFRSDPTYAYNGYSINRLAYYLFDEGVELARYGIETSFVEPYVMKVHTQVGDYIFNLK